MGIKDWLKNSIGTKLFVPIVKKLKSKGVSLKTQKKISKGLIATGTALGLGAVTGGTSTGRKLVVKGAKSLGKVASSPTGLLKLGGSVASASAVGGLLSTKSGRGFVSKIPEKAFSGGQEIGKGMEGGSVDWGKVLGAGGVIGGAGLAGLGLKKLWDKRKEIQPSSPIPNVAGGVTGLEDFSQEKQQPRTALEAQMPKINNIVQIQNYIN